MLAILAGVIFIYAVTTAVSGELIVGWGRIVVAGSIVTLLIGIITIMLGYKVFKAVKKSA